MRALTKITTGVAAAALAVVGLAGTAGAAVELPSASSSIVVPGVTTVSLTGTIVKVEGKYVTIVLSGTGRKVVVELDKATQVIGDVKEKAKVKVIVSAVDALLDRVTAKVFSVLV